MNLHVSYYMYETQLKYNIGDFSGWPLLYIQYHCSHNDDNHINNPPPPTIKIIIISYFQHHSLPSTTTTATTITSFTTTITTITTTTFHKSISSKSIVDYACFEFAGIFKLVYSGTVRPIIIQLIRNCSGEMWQKYPRKQPAAQADCGSGVGENGSHTGLTGRVVDPNTLKILAQYGSWSGWMVML